MIPLRGEIQGIEGEAVMPYREPSITQEMRYPRLSRRVKNMTNCFAIPGMHHRLLPEMQVNLSKRLSIVTFGSPLPWFLCNYKVYDLSH